MKSSVFAFIVLVALTGNAAGQPAVPAAGLAAEGEGRWADALRIYRDHDERAIVDGGNGRGPRSSATAP